MHREKTTLEELPIEEYKKICETFDEGVYEAISLENCVNGRKALGGPASENVKAQAAEESKSLKKMIISEINLRTKGKSEVERKLKNKSKVKIKQEYRSNRICRCRACTYTADSSGS